MRRSLLLLACCAAGPASQPASQPVCQPEADFRPRWSLGGEPVCDLPDRILIVGEKQMTALARPGLTATHAPITRTEYLPDRCDGPAGGHAGCSITFHRYYSPLLGEGHYLEFGNNAGNGLDDATSCREADSYAVIATCSTAQRFILVKSVEAYDQPCYHVEATLWEGAQVEGTVLPGDVDRAASSSGRWVYRFGDATLAFDRKGATLEVRGEREPCVVSRI